MQGTGAQSRGHTLPDQTGAARCRAQDRVWSLSITSCTQGLQMKLRGEELNSGTVLLKLTVTIPLTVPLHLHRCRLKIKSSILE